MYSLTRSRPTSRCSRRLATLGAAELGAVGRLKIANLTDLEEVMRVKRPSLATLVGLFMALGLPFVLTLLFSGGSKGLSWNPSRVILIIAEEWAVTLILLGIVFLWERRTLASIGVKQMSGRDVL
jgi:fatty acid desaturase